jgi:hypothetical protein
MKNKLSLLDTPDICRYWGKCSAAAFIRKMQIKTTMKYHLTPVAVDFYQ